MFQYVYVNLKGGSIEIHASNEEAARRKLAEKTSHPHLYTIHSSTDSEVTKRLDAAKQKVKK